MVTWSSEYDETQMENVKIVEERLSIKFPDDYLQCAIKYQGGSPSLRNIKLDASTVVQFKYLLTFLAFDELDILDTYNTTKKIIPSGLIPFGLGSDNYLFCFDYRLGRVPTISLFKPNSSGNDMVENIANSFEELTRKLY